jgi:hypothetical protein
VNYGSPYEDMKRNRHRIATLGFSSDSDTSAYGRCPVCIVQKKYILKEIDGKKMKYCTECGNTEPFDPVAQQQTQGKYSSRFGSASKPNSFIISKPKRKGRADILVDQDKEDIQRAFGSSSAQLIDSREETQQ